MAWTTLIDTSTLASLLGRPDVAIIDCRFLLDDPGWGRREYLANHIPGAAYADLDQDLSGAKTGSNGRHPLPEPEALRERLGQWGIASGIQVIAYDQDAGMFASRFWWLARWMGHREVAVLDGGFASWRAEGRPTEPGAAAITPRTFTGTADPAQVAAIEDVVEIVAGRRPQRLIDARAPERFRGEVEPLDRTPGHLPGAANHFFKTNVAPDGRFLPPDVLRQQFAASMAGTPADAVVAYCGSGVTACHNLLAMEHAGLSGARLYPGSWSEWSSDPDRPVATGE